MNHKMLKLFLSLTLMLGFIFSSSMNIQGQESVTTYKIYPTPQSIDYQTGDFVIHDTVNVIFENGIDQYTRDKLLSILEEKGIHAQQSQSFSDGMTNIQIGIHDSNQWVDQFAKENLHLDENFFTDHFDSYVLSIDNGSITIVGNSTDSAYYGVVSLMHIFHQMDGRTIQNLLIQDYADTKTRGFIEGYYGIPWSNEDRMSLMKFGGDFKMTSYIFAPKDDPYHKNLWRELYPADQLDAIKEMVKVGKASKCRFVWTAHPFMGGFNANQADEEIQSLLKKFDQLYDVGVRQFGVLGDDVGNLDRNVVIKMMNVVSQWGKEKGDVYDPVFCPAGYNHSWAGNYSELNDYDTGFPQNVQIFWTGEAVCKPVEQKTLNHFRNYNAHNGQRRPPLFWLNWPVNDINMNRILMGKGSMLHNDIDPQDLAGIVTNPMQDAQASKVALFAVADYAWNISNFDADTSWQDSFSYIDSDAGNSLAILARHMSDPSPNGHGLVLEESEDLKALFESYLQKLESSSLQKEDHEKLIRSFKEIKNACLDFWENSKNEELKKELKPFIDSLVDQMKAGIGFVKTQMAIEQGNFMDVWSYYSQAGSDLAASKNHSRLVINGSKMALPGSKRILPFLNALNDKLSPIVTTMVDDSKLVTTFITNRKDSPDNTLDVLTDNNENTEIILKNPNTVDVGTYIGLMYSKTIDLQNVTFKMGQSANARDTFASAKLQYTQNGTDWIDIEGSAYTDRRSLVQMQNLNIQTKGVRLVAMQAQDNVWIGCKDILVNQVQEDDSSFMAKGKAIYNQDNMSIPNGYGSLDRLTDKNTSAYTAFAKGPYQGEDRDTTQKGAYIGLAFENLTEIDHFILEQGSSGQEGDRIDRATLQYTQNGADWIDIGTYDNLGTHVDLTFDTVTAQKIRFVNEQAKNIWWRVREVSANKQKDQIHPKVFVSNRYSVYGTYSKDKILDGNESTFAWFRTPNNAADVGDYVGVDLGTPAYLQSVHYSMGSDFWNAYDLEYSKDGQTYTKYKSFSGAVADADLVGDHIQARYVRMVNKASKPVWLQVKELNVQASIQEDRGLDYIYTNLDKDDFVNARIDASKDQYTMQGIDEIVLKPNEYIGIKMDRIHEIASIQADPLSNLTLQTSLNGKIWTKVSDFNQIEDSHYIRLLNQTDEDVSVLTSSLIVNTHEIQPISVKSTNYGSKDTHLLAFDHDRTTEAILQKSQHTGSYITYDLGQDVDLHSLKLVLHDGTTDFPRHAKISVSKNGQDWQEVLVIGNQSDENPGEAENTDVITDLFPTHEISYNTLENNQIHTTARYIKFEITRDKVGNDKWVRIREIELNGGNLYLPSENDPTLVASGLIEGQGNTMKNMVDKDVATTFHPLTDKAGWFTYRLSDDKSVNKVTILQSPEKISKAQVKAHVLKDGQQEEVVLGHLEGSLNEFNTSSFDQVLDLSVAWDDGMAPTIHEIVLSSQNQNALESKTLQQAIQMAKDENLSKLTQQSQQAIQDAITFGESILQNPYSTQAMLDSALARIQSALHDKVEKPDLETYDQTIQKLIKNVKSQNKYLPKTWKPYEQELEKALDLKKNPNVSQEQLDSQLESLRYSVSQLVYEVESAESLRLQVEQLQTLKESDYTSYTYGQLNDLLIEAKDLMILDRQQRQDPSLMQKQHERLTLYVDNSLLSIHVLKHLEDTLSSAKALETNQYTSTTAQALQKAIDQAANVINNPQILKSDVQSTTDLLQAAINNLEKREQVSKDTLKKALEEAKNLDESLYTPESYAPFKEVIKEAEDLLVKDEVTQEEVNALIQKLESGKNDLHEKINVDPSKLDILLETTRALKQEDYTASTWQSLRNKQDQAKTLLEKVDVTQEEIDQMLDELQQAYQALVKKADTSKLQALIDEMSTLNEGLYTPESYVSLKETIKEANGILAKEDATQDEVDGIFNKLQERKEALVRNIDIVDKTELKKLLDEINKLGETLYTPESYAILKEIVNEAESVLVDDNAVQDTIDSILSKLQYAKEKLVCNPKITDKTQLKDLLDVANNKEENLYTPKTYASLKKVIEEADMILNKEDASQEDVDETIKKLQLVLDQLVKKANKEVLIRNINDFIQLNEKDYTAESWSNLKKQIQDAKKILTNEDVTQEEVDQSISGLKAAQENLQISLNPVEDLKEKIQNWLQENEEVDASQYSPSSFAVYINAKEGIKSLLKQNDISKDQLQKAFDQLQESYEKLEWVKPDVNITKLEALIQIIEGLKEENYTSKSWNDLMDALNSARKVLSNPDKTQEQVDQVYEVLNTCYDKLVEHKKDTTEPAKEGNSTSANVVKSNKNKYKTNMSVGFYVGILITVVSIAGICILELVKKMKSKNVNKE